MEYKDAFEILAKVKEGISEYEKDTRLTNNVTAGQLYVALTHVLGKAALQQADSADGDITQSNPCDSCQTWDLPEACHYCNRR